MSNSSPPPRPPDSPIRTLFVVGNSRSGTTMLARMLGRHSRIHTFKELHFFEEMWQPGDARVRLDPERALALAERLLHNEREWYHTRQRPGQYREAARRVLERAGPDPAPHEILAAFVMAEAEANGKDVACEQTPRNVFYLREILELFDDAGVLEITRDPRDVLLSQKNWWKRRFRGTAGLPWRATLTRWVNYHPLTTTLLWRGGVRAGDLVRAHERVVTLRFEDLVADPRGELERALKHLGFALEAGMLDVTRISSSNRANRDATGVDPSVVGQWRAGLSPTEVWLSQRLTAAELRALRYEVAPVRPRPLPFLLQALLLPLKTALAVVVNGGRVRNLPAAVRRRLGRTRS